MDDLDVELLARAIEVSVASETRRLRREARYWPFVYALRRRRKLRCRTRYDVRPPAHVMVRFYLMRLRRLLPW